jgi:hypothetical protein
MCKDKETNTRQRQDKEREMRNKTDLHEEEISVLYQVGDAHPCCQCALNDTSK